MMHLTRKGTSKHLKLDALILIVFVLGIISMFFVQDFTENMVTGAAIGIQPDIGNENSIIDETLEEQVVIDKPMIDVPVVNDLIINDTIGNNLLIQEDGENSSLQEVTISDDKLYQPNKQVWKVKSNSEDFYMEMVDEDTFKYKVKPGSKNKPNKKKKLKKTKQKGKFGFSNSAKINLNEYNGTFDLDFNKNGYNFNKTDKFKLGDDSVLFEYDDTNELIYNFAEGNVSIIPYYLIDGELYTIPVAQVEIRILDDSFKFGYDITVNESSEVADLSSIILKYVPSSGIEFVYDGNYGFHIDQECNFTDYFSEINPIVKNVSCDIVFDASDIVSSTFRNSSFTLNLTVNTTEAWFYIGNNWSLVQDGDVIVIDPTISDEFSSNVGGNYTNTTWNSGDSAIELDDDALLIYKFDDNESKAYDLSVNANHYDTIAPSPSTSCQFGSLCLDFDGTNDYVRVKDHGYLNVPTNFTWSAFVYPRETDGDIISKYATSSDFNYLMGLFSGKLRCYVRDSGVKFAASTSTIAQDTWTHVVCMHNTTSIAAIVDGTVEGVTHGLGALDTTTNDLVFGTEDVAEASGQGVYFDGLIQCVQLWNNTVSTQGINSRMTLSSTCNNSLFSEFGNSPIATWNLSSYEKVQEEVVSSIHGDLGPFFNETGVNGGSYEFDGLEDYVDTGERNIFNITSNTNITFMTWFNPNSVTITTVPNGALFSLSTGSFTNTGGYTAYVEDNDFNFGYNNGSSGSNTISLANVLANDNQWYHVAVVIYRQGSIQENITIYIDGVGQTSQANARNGSWAAPVNLLVGALNSANWFFNGTMDDLIIINRSLSGEEISQVYNGNKAVHDYIPKYKPSGDYIGNIKDAGYQTNWTSINLSGSFDNDSNIFRENSDTNVALWYTLDNHTLDQTGTQDASTNGSKYDFSGRGINGSYYFDGLNDEINFTNYALTDFGAWSMWLRNNSGWYHLTNASGITYVNCEITGQSYFPIMYTGSNIVIGRNAGSTYHKGGIDEVKFYTNNLSKAEVCSEYRKTKGSKVAVQFRTSPDNITWSSWYDNVPPNLQTGNVTLNISIPLGQHGQYRLLYDGTDTELTGKITRADVDYQNDTTAPTFNTATNISEGLFKRYTNFTANLTIRDDMAGNGTYIFSTNASGTWENRSNGTYSGIEYNASVSVNITPAQGTGVCWQYWANDSQNNVGLSEIYCFAVNNTAPIAQSVFVNSSDNLNRSNSTLIGNWTFYDVDDDTQMGMETLWYNNSVEIVPLRDFSSITGGNLSRGENWTFSIKVGDGTTWGDWVNSSNLTIVNTVPEVQSVYVNSSDNLNRSNSTLIGNWTFYDIDGDSQNKTEIFWYNNSVEIVELRNLTSIIGGNLSKGENWTFSIRVYDDTNWSDLVNSSNLTIVNTAPTFNETLSSRSVISGNQITFTINCSDIDNDTVAYYDNTTLFDINPNSGLVTDTPVSGDVGAYKINITCGDNFSNTSQTFTYTITAVAATVDEETTATAGGGAGGGGAGTLRSPSVFSSLFEFIEKGVPIAVTIPEIEGFDKIIFESSVDLENDWIKVEKIVFAPKSFEQDWYNLFKISSGKINDNLQTANIYYSVNKNWLTTRELDRFGVALFHFEGSSWNELTPSFVGADDDNYYYRSTADSFSYFLIGERESKESFEKLTEVIIEKEVEEKQVLEEEKVERIEPVIKKPSVFVNYKIKLGDFWESFSPKMKSLSGKVSAVIVKVNLEKIKLSFKNDGVYWLMGVVLLVLIILLISLIKKKRKKMVVLDKKIRAKKKEKIIPKKEKKVTEKKSISERKFFVRNQKRILSIIFLILLAVGIYFAIPRLDKIVSFAAQFKLRIMDLGLWIVPLIAFLISLIIIIYLLRSGRKEKENIMTMTKEKTIQKALSPKKSLQLKKFIKECNLKKISDYKMKKMLVQEGWNKETISEYIKEYKKNK